MRLIDLDQTIFVPIVDESRGGVEYEMQMTLVQFFERFFEGFQPEIVDAVPVEWLEQRFYDNPKTQWAEKCRDVFTGWQKWQSMQKEQEAR